MGKFDSCHHNSVKLGVMLKIMPLNGMIYLLSLPYPCSYFTINYFMSLTLLTNQMVNTRSVSGVDQPPVQRQRSGSNPHPNNMQNQNNQNQNQAPPQQPTGMEQFLATQTQILTNMAATMANLQAQMQQAPPQQPPPRDHHTDFMSHKLPTFSHSPDPLQADDWIKTIEKMLNIA